MQQMRIATESAIDEHELSHERPGLTQTVISEEVTTQRSEAQSSPH